MVRVGDWKTGRATRFTRKCYEFRSWDPTRDRLLLYLQAARVAALCIGRFGPIYVIFKFRSFNFKAYIYIYIFL